MTLNKSAKWFSTYYGLDIPQYLLEFVDFRIDKDAKLYIDSYAITKDPTDLGVECHNSIVSYFLSLRDAVISGNNIKVKDLSRGYFSEQGQIHFGVSKSVGNGRGIGKSQELKVVKAISDSKAFKVGLLEGIQELELHIEGIGPDKISDLLSNVIMSQLARFTETTCEKYGIPTRPCPVSPFWDKDKKEWGGGYFNLPTKDLRSYILVPKRFVRRDRDIMNHTEFYNMYVLEIIGRELVSANDSLVKTLKTGEKKITKKSIKEDERFLINKDLISSFIVKNPDTIKKYRSDLKKEYKPVDPAVFTGKDKVDDKKIEKLIFTLNSLESGNTSSTKYQKIVYALLEFVFDWCLSNFSWEYKMDNGRSRIDILTTNISGGGLFEYLRSGYNALTIPIECKNYSSDMANNEFNQINERMGLKTTRIGFLFCRKVENKEAMRKHQSNRWLRTNNLILLMDDEILVKLVDLRLSRNFKGIEDLLSGLIRDVQYDTAS